MFGFYLQKDAMAMYTKCVILESPICCNTSTADPVVTECRRLFRLVQLLNKKYNKEMYKLTCICKLSLYVYVNILFLLLIL